MTDLLWLWLLAYLLLAAARQLAAAIHHSTDTPRPAVMPASVPATIETARMENEQ